MNYNYYRTFIRISADCPVKRSVAPVIKGERVSVAVLEYGLLSSSHYVYTQEELLFQVHVRRQGISRSLLESKRDALWTDFFSRRGRRRSRIAPPRKHHRVPEVLCTRKTGVRCTVGRLLPSWAAGTR